MGKGQQQRILFGFGLWGWHTDGVRRSQYSLSNFCTAKIFCVWEFYALSSETVPVFLRNNGAAKCMQKNDLSGAVPIHFWILNSHIFFFLLFEYPWWRKALNILMCSRVRWPSYCSLVCVSLLWGLGFSLPFPFSAVNLVIEQKALQCQTLDKARLEGEECGQPLT